MRFNRNFSRRSILRGLGVSAAMSPLVPLLQARGEVSGAPKRLIMLTNPGGQAREHWIPDAADGLQFGDILAPLQDHSDDVVVIDGLGWWIDDGPGVDHHRISITWTGSPLEDDGDEGGLNTGVSIDQRIAEAIGNETAYRSLEFGVQNGSPGKTSRVSYGSPLQPIETEQDPFAMYERVFADLGDPDPALAQLRARRKSVLDAVGGHLDEVADKVSAEDRLKLEAHADAVRAIELRLDNVPTCEAPELGATFDPGDNDNYPLVSRMQIDLMVLALSCDLTRVASLMWSRGSPKNRFSWLVDDDREHHTITHDSSDQARADLITINRWHAEEVAYLIQALEAVPEGDGTLFDNTLIVWGSNLSDVQSHNQHPLPFLLAGSCGGQLSGGRLLTFDEQRHNRLLVSVCNLMGLTEVTEHGSLDDGAGGLTGLV